MAEEKSYESILQDFPVKPVNGSYLMSSTDPQTYVSEDGLFTITFAWGTSTASSYPSVYDTKETIIRMEKNQEMTISMADGKSKIKQIAFTFDKNKFDYCSTGSYSGSTWTASDATSSVTFKRAAGYVRIKGMTITYEPATVATKQAVTLSMPESASIDLLETFDAKASLTVPDGGEAATGAITYSVEPATGDFTIDSKTGLFTAGKTNGSYKIKATFAGDENYNMAEETTTVTVSSRVWALKNYIHVTDASQLVDGAQYILVYDDGTYFNYMGDYSSSSFEAANIQGNRYSGGLIPAGIENTYNNPSIMPFTLKAVDDKFALYTAFGYLKSFEYWNNVMAGLNVTTNYEDTDFEKWTITIDGEGNAHIVNVADNAFSLAYTQLGDKYVYQATTSPKSVQLYAKCADMPFKEQALGYGTFVMPDAYQMPAGVTGYAISGLNESDKTKLVKEKAYSAGELVPALTPLLVYNENVAGADETAYPILVNKEVKASYTDKNYLEYKRDASNMTASKQDVAVYYYKLTKNTSEEDYKPLGFYWGAADGAAFAMVNNSSAYLALPQGINAAAGLLFDEAGEATGIQLTPAEETAAPAVYNLQGVRVSGKLAKGLYIVNGKKVLVK